MWYHFRERCRCVLEKDSVCDTVPSSLSFKPSRQALKETSRTTANDSACNQGSLQCHASLSLPLNRTSSLHRLHVAPDPGPQQGATTATAAPGRCPLTSPYGGTRPEGQLQRMIRLQQEAPCPTVPACTAETPQISSPLHHRLPGKQVSLWRRAKRRNQS